MNRVFLSGNLTRNPECKHTPNGAIVCNFGLAVNERWTDTDTGELRENVTFIDCEAWNRPAENIFKYFRKGMPILIEGALKFESWESDGQTRNRVKVRVQRFEFMGRETSAPPVESIPEPPTLDPETESETVHF